MSASRDELIDAATSAEVHLELERMLLARVPDEDGVDVRPTTPLKAVGQLHRLRGFLTEHVAEKPGGDDWSPIKIWALLQAAVESASAAQAIDEFARFGSLQPDATPAHLIRRNLFAAKVLLGLVDVEDESRAAESSLELLQMLRKRPMYSSRSLKEHITARKAYLLPLFGYAAVDSFGLHSKSMRGITSVFLAAVVDQVMSDYELSEEATPIATSDFPFVAGVDAAMHRLSMAPSRLSEYPAHLTTEVLVDLLQYRPPAPLVGQQRLPGIPILPPGSKESSFTDLCQMIGESGKRLVLIGNAGFGKSTTMRALALEQVRTTGVEKVLYMTAAALADAIKSATAAGPANAARQLVVATASSLGLVALDLTDAQLEQVARQPDLLVLVDGLDEITSRDRSQVIEFLSDCDGFEGSITISARFDVRTRLIKSWTVMSVGGYKNSQKLIDLWFEGRDSDARFRAQVKLRDPAFREIRSSPMLVGFLALVAEFGRDASTVDDLYDEYISLTLERSWKGPDGAEYDDERAYLMLETARDLAWEMATGGPQNDQWVSSISKRKAFGFFPKDDRSRVAALLDVEALFEVSPSRASRQSTAFSWTHQTIQEHLVGNEIARRLTTGAISAESLSKLASQSEGWTAAVGRAVVAVDEHVRLRALESLWGVSAPRVDRLAALMVIEWLVRASPSGSRAPFFALSRAAVEDAKWVASAAPEAAILDVLEDHLLAGRFELAMATIGALDNSERQEDALASMATAVELSQTPEWRRRVLRYAVAAANTPLQGFVALLRDIMRGDSDFLYEGERALTGEQARNLTRHLHLFDYPEPRLRMMVSIAIASEEGSESIRAMRPDASRQIEIVDLMLELSNGMDPRYRDEASFDPLNPVEIAALSGDHGSTVQFRVASVLHPARVLQARMPNAWGAVGFLSRAFAEGSWFMGSSGVTSSNIEHYRPHWRLQSARMISLMQGLHRLQASKDPHADAQLLELHRRMLATEPAGHVPTSSPQMSLNDFNTMVVDHFLRVGIDRLIDGLEMTGASAWAFTVGDIPPLVEVWNASFWKVYPGNPLVRIPWIAEWRAAEEERHAIARFQRLAEWGARGGLPVLRSLSSMWQRGISIERAFEGIDPGVLQLRANRDVLDEWMAREGRLLRWRSIREDWLRSRLDGRTVEGIL